MQQSAEDFRKWMKEKRPNIILSLYQDRLVEVVFGSFLFSSGRRTGKSFLISLLAEYDKEWLSFKQERCNHPDHTWRGSEAPCSECGKIL